jgi:hypothetical protein
MSGPRPRIPLTAAQLELVFEGLELVAEGTADAGKLKEAVELAGRVRQVLDRVKGKQVAS